MNDKKKSRKEMILEYKERPISGGIYVIRNIENSKYLLVADIDLKSAKNRFDFSVKTESGLYKGVESDLKKYGGKSFTFEILEEIDKKADESMNLFKDKLNELKEKYSNEFDENKSY